MKDETRKRLSELILEELAEKIRFDENLRRKLEPFTDLPVEKVATAIIRQFEYLLSSELRELIIHLIEQEVAAEESIEPSAEIPAVEEESVSVSEEIIPAEEEKILQELPTSESIMEHFAQKEHFEFEPLDIELKPDDWLYLYGFSYAPDSTGKGFPSKKLALTGIDRKNNIFLLDYGDIRFYMNKMAVDDYPLDKSGKPMIASTRLSQIKFEHEKILNILRTEDVIVTYPPWSIVQNRESFISNVEDRYVELLRGLIDAHDAIEWNVEVFAYDNHMIKLPSIVQEVKVRTTHREAKHRTSNGKDVKLLERLMMSEKKFAQEIHSQLLLHSTKAKIDFMIRLDNAFMDDWKSILSSRYTVGKEKRKIFCNTISNLQKEYEEYKLMFHISNPNVHLSFLL